ncbi:MAG: hypoxanthine phosphoribosyltransferase [Halobacteriovoraceae bacterium]|nr:hypoxanthine phosphoribosyltransferase [Halobacteriovoraceae bacterium]MCB9095116.1 hypoxanthine phosphoribosyltransferase [Halobacteriovoraceae bacterium]
MEKKIKTFISEEEIEKRLQELGQEIRNDLGDQEVVLLCVLKGATLFCADLMRKIGGPLQLEFIRVSSYGDGTESSGKVDIGYKFSKEIAGKHVILVEDIVDSGLTIKEVKKHLIEKESPKSVKLASLLSKPSRREHTVEIDYLGFEIEDKFVIGYGLDFAQNFRELPYIGVLEE